MICETTLLFLGFTNLMRVQNLPKPMIKKSVWYVFRFYDGEKKVEQKLEDGARHLKDDVKEGWSKVSHAAGRSTDR